jgi:hypothetical protein
LLPNTVLEQTKASPIPCTKQIMPLTAPSGIQRRVKTTAPSAAVLIAPIVSRPGCYSIRMPAVRSGALLVALSALSTGGCSLLAPGDDELVGTRPDAEADGYAAVVISAGPIAYWRLDEPAGATLAIDASGNGHHAVVGGKLGGAQFGRQGLIDGSSGALELSGSGFLDVPAAAPFRFAGTKPFSLEAWVVPKSLATGSTRNIAACQPLADDTAGWYWFHNGPLLQAERRSGGAVQGAYAGDALVDGKRIFLVAAFDGERWSLYRDGALLAESKGDQPVSLADLDNGFRWGGRPSENETNLFVGLLDELAVYDRALTSIEVAQHHAAGGGP